MVAERLNGTIAANNTVNGPGGFNVDSCSTKSPHNYSAPLLEMNPAQLFTLSTGAMHELASSTTLFQLHFRPKFTLTTYSRMLILIVSKEFLCWNTFSEPLANLGRCQTFKFRDAENLLPDYLKV